MMNAGGDTSSRNRLPRNAIHQREVACVRRRVGRRFLRLAAMASSAVLLALAAPSALGTPSADAAPSGEAFYHPPTSFDTTPGSVVRSRPTTVGIAPIPGADIDARSSLLMYTSTNAQGEPVAVTGTVLVPTREWHGRGERPLVVIGSGTIGAGDQCAPSKLLHHGQHYEQMAIGLLLAHGYSVAMPDYEGLGTPGDHPYLNRLSLGQTMLDLARAARSGPFGVDSNSPVALWGYSEGGKASGSAAELAADYAPELPIYAAFVGAPAPDLADLARLGDGSLLGAGVGWVVNGFIAAYPQHRKAFLAPFNSDGRTVLKMVNDYCVYDAPRMLPLHQGPSSYRGLPHERALGAGSRGSASGQGGTAHAGVGQSEPGR